MDGRRVHHAARHLLVEVLVHRVMQIRGVTLRVIRVLNVDIFVMFSLMLNVFWIFLPWGSS